MTDRRCMRSVRRSAACVITATVVSAVTAHAQTPGARTPGDPLNSGSTGRVQVTAGADYDKPGPLWRYLFGSNWRGVWATPIEADVLDLSTYAGGLTLF